MQQILLQQESTLLYILALLYGKELLKGKELYLSV